MIKRYIKFKNSDVIKRINCLTNKEFRRIIRNIYDNS